MAFSEYMNFTKMGADSSVENAPEFICPICLPKPKSSGFQWKKSSLGVRSPCGSVPNFLNAFALEN